MDVYDYFKAKLFMKYFYILGWTAIEREPSMHRNYSQRYPTAHGLLSIQKQCD